MSATCSVIKMRKKIQRSFLYISILSILLYAGGTIFLFIHNERSNSIRIVHNQSQYIQANYDKIFNDEVKQDLNKLITQSRISIIDESGTVIYDNQIPLDQIENHNDRSEVIEARNNGTGNAERKSDSLASQTYYYATLMEDGNILRISIPILSIFAVMKLISPFTILTLIFVGLHAMVASNNLTKRIVSPIEKVDLKSNLSSPYTELDLYFSLMREQRSESKRQNKRLSKRNETINTILNTMQEGFAIIDNSSNIFLANKAFLELMKVKHYIVGETLVRYVSDRNLIEKVNEALSGKSSRHKMTIDNKMYQVYINHASIVDEDVAILYFVDISLEYANQTYREQFSANVSHELKTPLTIIKGLSELIANNLVDNNDISNFGLKIESQSDRLLDIIDNIMLISQLDEQANKSVMSQINLKSLSEDVLNHLQHKLRKKDIQLNVNVDDVMINGNYQMLDELLYNLIDNAIKYNEENGKLDFTIQHKDDSIVITVSNDGYQIPSKDRQHIFDRFYRVDESRNKQSGGTGLGLAIVKHIVAYHKGTVSILPELRSTFEVILPKY